MVQNYNWKNSPKPILSVSCFLNTFHGFQVNLKECNQPLTIICWDICYHVWDGKIETFQKPLKSVLEMEFGRWIFLHVFMDKFWQMTFFEKWMAKNGVRPLDMDMTRSIYFVFAHKINNISYFMLIRIIIDWRKVWPSYGIFGEYKFPNTDCAVLLKSHWIYGFEASPVGETGRTANSVHRYSIQR